MSRKVKRQLQNGLYRGQKYKFEGYPEWYNEQLARNQPIRLSRFQGNIKQAAYFYEKESNKLHFANHVLKFQLQAVLKEISQLTSMVQEVQEQENSSADQKKKRVRRCASQIQRKYVCPVTNCEKSYGTEGSMAQHMRLKHPGVNYVMADLDPDAHTQKQEYEQVKKEEKMPKTEHPKKQ